MGTSAASDHRHPVTHAERLRLEDALQRRHVDDEHCSAIEPTNASTSQRFFSDSSEKTVRVSLRKLNACSSCASTMAVNSIVCACCGLSPVNQPARDAEVQTSAPTVMSAPCHSDLELARAR